MRIAWAIAALLVMTSSVSAVEARVSVRDGHSGVCFDGTTRRHYINGDLAFEGAETAPPSSTKSIRIGIGFQSGIVFTPPPRRRPTTF